MTSRSDVTSPRRARARGPPTIGPDTEAGETSVARCLQHGPDERGAHDILRRQTNEAADQRDGHRKDPRELVIAGPPRALRQAPRWLRGNGAFGVGGRDAHGHDGFPSLGGKDIGSPSSCCLNFAIISWVTGPAYAPSGIGGFGGSGGFAWRSA